VKITLQHIRAMKGREKIAALTAYDYPMTRLLDECGVPLLLVGDSLGMVVLGYPDTTHVTMDEMEHHVRAAARAKPRALLGADLPFKSYETPAQALENSRRLIAAGADAVKAEGGRAIAEQVRAIASAGIPFIGHLGMLPQHVIEEGGYHKKGRSEAEHAALIQDAQALAEAGAFAIVLELVMPEVAQDLTEKISVPTIGIGSGPHCDGQILVTHDLWGTFPWFTPKFVKKQLNTAEQMRAIVAEWKQTILNEEAHARKRIRCCVDGGRVGEARATARSGGARRDTSATRDAGAHRSKPNRQRQRPGDGTAGGHHGRKKNRRVDPALSSAAHFALRSEFRNSGGARSDCHHRFRKDRRADRRGNGSVDGRERRGADHLRHVQSGGQNDAHH
jgi:3-methyl-2-oxobutanoate hydroxymethyltransferase